MDFSIFHWKFSIFLRSLWSTWKSCGWNTGKNIEFCRLFWLVLIISAFCATIVLSLKSLDRYETKSTVVTIERDHYYWNTSLPSLTICPTSNRIDRVYFNEYCQKRGIDGDDKVEFYDFLESMANATYDTFHQIKNHSSVEVRIVACWRTFIRRMIFFFFWIFFRNCICCRRIIWCWFIICRGIGHGSQILKNASEHIETGSWFAVSRYSLNMAFVTRPTIFWQPICPQSGCIPVFHRVSISNLIILLIVAIFRLLLTGVNPLPPVADSFLENREIIEVLAGNLFDGDMGYNMVGFGDHITVNILHSQRDEHFFTRTFYHVQDVPSQSVRNHQYRESELLHGLRHWIPLLFEWSNRGQEFPKVRENCMTLIS